MTDSEHLYRRHGELVDKKFLDGLSADEENELKAIRVQLDEANESFYRPMEWQLERHRRELEQELKRLGGQDSGERGGVMAEQKLLNGSSTWTNVVCADCGKMVWAVMYHDDLTWRPAQEHECINGIVLPPTATLPAAVEARHE